MNGFDLAEWTSLHPAVRASSPALFTSFLLRMPQVMLACALALAANGLMDARMRWMVRVWAGLLALRMVPPTEFFTGTSGDPNYRQMALLTVMGLAAVGGALALYRAPRRWQTVTLVFILIIGIVAGWMGLSRSVELFDNFQIDTKTGPGIIGLTVFSAVGAMLASASELKKSG